MNRKRSALNHSDHTPEIPRLKKIVGQLAGMEKMINEGRPCTEIMQQARAAHSAMKSLEVAILKRHLSTCIANSAKYESSQAFNHRLKDLLALIKG
jgi:DNA-binding FrmR family transcriptional regulator